MTELERYNELVSAVNACADAQAALAEIGRELAYRLDSERTGYPWDLSETLDMHLRAEEAAKSVEELTEYIIAELRRENIRNGK